MHKRTSEANLYHTISHLENRIDAYTRLLNWPALTQSLEADLTKLKEQYVTAYPERAATRARLKTTITKTSTPGECKGL
jgi:hypothetical protein